MKKIGINILLVLAILFVLNLVYSHTLYARDLQSKYPEAMQLRESQPRTDIYYFGESSNVTYAPSDTNRKSISELLQDQYPSLRITNINKYATHAGIYREWLKQLRQPSDLPGALVVTMNLRSFGAGWIHSSLETQLQEAFVLSRPLPPLINRFLLSLQAFDHKTNEEREREVRREWKTTELKFPFPFPHKTVHDWDHAMAMGGHSRPDGSWDQKKIELACHYIKGYAFNITEENPRIKDFDAIYDWCGKYGVALCLNLMSENVHFADSLVGRELVFLMRQNRDYLVKRYNREHCKVADNLETVSSSSFIDQNWTTEHYDIAGRMAIATNLADTLKSRYGKHYRKTY